MITAQAFPNAEIIASDLDAFGKVLVVVRLWCMHATGFVILQNHQQCVGFCICLTVANARISSEQERPTCVHR